MSNIIQDVEIGIKDAEQWIAKEFNSTVPKAIQVAITITNDVKAALASGAVNDVALVIQGVFPSVKNLPTEVATALGGIVGNVLAAELGLQAVVGGITPANASAFATEVCNVFDVSANNSKIDSDIAGKATQIFLADTTKTWYSYLTDIEQVLAVIKQDEAAA